MSHAKLKVLGDTKKRMYGPRCLLICGFSVDERKIILDMIEKKKFKNLPVVFSSEESRDVKVKEMLLRQDRSGLENECRLERAIILSGVTEKELHRSMSAYKKIKLPKPLWATLTPTSENWTLEALIAELSSERLSFEK